ncbi:LacI family DNA-binding transcriptional regulator [uncultured Dysosmobacter sp.]|uniref:LacI family DNA-binding transcriptional regulator n=1 Tax=uncultured Dysosmobacter sp. TaxID=2591384 RepID=UPI00262B1B6C|nr:LacI family DNA-binding transcriptional regulator [uncultured Dysosmobacter sp.]
MQPQQVTILDVAKDAAVSPATVSRVLNNNSRVDPALKERVLASVRKLGYLPNANAQSLITRNTYEIGFLVSDISNSYYGTIAREVENIVNPKNYNLILCSTDEAKPREYAYLQMMMRRHVDGLIVNPTCMNNDVIAEFSKFMPVLLMNRHIDHPGFRGDFIDTDGYTGCKLITTELLRAGHRKIYCVHGPFIYPNARMRFQGFVDAMQEYGISVDKNYPYLFNGQFTIAGGKLAVENMLQLSDPPTAIVSESNMCTLGILQQLQRYRIDIPGDISLCGHDQIDNMELFDVKPVSAVYDLQEIAQCVGKTILERIQDPGLAARHYEFQATLSPGNSIAAPSQGLPQKLRSELRRHKAQ